MELKTHQLSQDGFNFNLIEYFSSADASDLLLILPGAGYSYLGPLMYYPTQWMIQRPHSAVLAVDYDFRFSEVDRQKVLKGITSQTVAHISARYKCRRLWILGKSIGTRIAASLVLNHKDFLQKFETKIVLLTPVWGDESSFSIMGKTDFECLHIIGDADAHFSADRLKGIQANPKNQLLVLKDADHSLDIDSSYEKTVIGHGQVFKTIYKFLDNSSASSA